MIQVERVTKVFGPITAVNEISFSVQRGEIVGFLGPNGAGKTTTMRILTGFIPPTSGRAWVAGFDVVKQSLDVKRRVGYMPENVPMYPEMRVQEYLFYRAKLKDVPRKHRKARVEYAMERCGLLGVRRQLIGTLSKGYRQRVGLADALSHDPDILILDEPTIGLDPIQIREARKLIAELGQDHTILLSTHILPEVEMVCERVIIIAEGRIALTARLDELQRDSVITLEVRGPEQQIRNALQTIDGVDRINTMGFDDGVVQLEIRTRDGLDLREEISRKVTHNGWIIRQLGLRRRTLEDQFIEATMRMQREVA